MRKIRAAIRFAVFFIATFAIYAVWFVGSFVVPNKIYWRQIMFEAWQLAFVKISGMRIEVAGTPPAPPFFLVSNHLSYVDIPALRAVVKGVFVAKKEIASWFAVGRIVSDMGMIFINREKKRDIPRAGREIIERLNAGEGVIVFPEGTSTKGEEVLKFNSSFLEFAARTDLPVSYASIRYRTPAGEMSATEAVCWWDETTFMAHLWRLLQIREYTAVITFGDEPVQNPNRKELARELWEKVSESFIPVL